MARQRTRTGEEPPDRWWAGWAVAAGGLLIAVMLAAGAGIEDYVDKSINSHPTIKRIAEDVAYIRGKLDSSSTLERQGK